MSREINVIADAEKGKSNKREGMYSLQGRIRLKFIVYAC
jgi:hypothetical protein